MIEKILYPGQATTILGSLKYPDNFSKSQGLNQLWYKDTSTQPVGYRKIQCDSNSVDPTTSFSWRLSVKSSPEVPRFIIVGFQTDKSGSQEQNPSIFDNVNVRDIYVTLNSNNYPALDYNLSFPKQLFSRAYCHDAEFRSKVFNMCELISNPYFTLTEYKTLYPLFLFDVSKQSEKLKYSTTDIQIKADFNANVDVGTQVFAVTISDRLINFQSDGNKMSVVIDSLEVSITDQDDHLLNLRNEDLTIRFHIREAR